VEYTQFVPDSRKKNESASSERHPSFLFEVAHRRNERCAATGFVSFVSDSHAVDGVLLVSTNDRAALVPGDGASALIADQNNGLPANAYVTRTCTYCLAAM
jgi:hypothetical protein